MFGFVSTKFAVVFYIEAFFCLPGIQIRDSLQTQTSLKILMEGVQTQLKERYEQIT